MIANCYTATTGPYRTPFIQVTTAIVGDDPGCMLNPPPGAGAKGNSPSRSPAMTGRYIPADSAPFVDWLDRLNVLKTSPQPQAGVDEPPCEQTFPIAEAILHSLQRHSLAPTHIMPSAEGGIAIVFDYGDRYADIEVLNSGEVLAVTSDRKVVPTVWPVTVNSDSSLQGSVLTIRDHLHI